MAHATIDNTTDTTSGWQLQKSAKITDFSDVWDTVVPRDAPHLRSGMLQAVEDSKLLEKPAYFILMAGGQPAAVAYVYTLPIDPMATAPAAINQLVSRIRERAPGFMWGSMRVCGSPLSNCNSGVCFSPQLDPDQQKAAMSQLAAAVIGNATIDQTVYFREFRDEDVEGYAHPLVGRGCFEVKPPPGTQLDLRWDSYDDYLAALRRKYRKKIRTDLKAAEALDFELVDDFSDLAPTAFRLYKNVLANADYVLETLNEEFFAALARFDQSKLLVARTKETGDIVGINLLLFGDAVMQNLFIGFDYQSNEKYHTYFSVVHNSLRQAIEHGCSRIEFGQDSYEFKARLGAVPYNLTGYMKHRIWPIHFLMRSSRDRLFPTHEGVVHDVFGDAS